MLLALIIVPQIVSAQGIGEPPPDINLPKDVNLIQAVVNIINFVLSLLGLVAVIMIIIGGFKYMMSGGDEDKVKKAKKLLISGLVGLIIIILAYAIASFVINLIQNSASA